MQLVRARAATVPEEQVTKDEWTALLAGRPSRLVDGIHDPDDPEPSYDLLWEQLAGGPRATPAPAEARDAKRRR